MFQHVALMPHRRNSHRIVGRNQQLNLMSEHSLLSQLHIQYKVHWRVQRLMYSLRMKKEIELFQNILL